MEDAILSAQLAKTGNPMDICNTPEWLQALKEDNEFDGAGTVGAALDGPYVKAVNSLTTEQLKEIKQKARLQSILFTELSDWMKTWELGIGFEDVYIVARRIMREHLQILTPEQKNWIENLLVEDKEVERTADKPVRQETKKILSDMFTSGDWERLADKAAKSAKAHILNVGQVKVAEIEPAEAA